MRAARLGFEVAVEDKKLYFRKRVDADSGIKLVFGVPGDSTLERFMPRLSTAHQVSEVKVFGWDPVKKKEIVGSAKPQSSKLGDKHGSAVAIDKHKDVLQVIHESPVSSKEEADNIAKSILNDRMMGFITGDGVCRGNPDIKPGIIVNINVQDKRFDGKYHITAVRHRYVHAGPAGGYRTEFNFRRDAKSDSYASATGVTSAPENRPQKSALRPLRGLTPKRTDDYTFRALNSGGGARWTKRRR